MRSFIANFGSPLTSIKLSSAFSTTPEERSKNLQRLSFVASELARAGAAVILAPTVYTQAARDTVKSTILSQAGSGANFFAIDVATPLEHCEANDRKGVYARARAGEISGVAGIDVEFEPFERAQLTVDVMKQNIPEIVHSTLFFRMPRRRGSGTDPVLFKASSSFSRPSHCCRLVD